MRRFREAARQAGRWAVARARVERVSTGTQHFDPRALPLGMSALSRTIDAQSYIQHQFGKHMCQPEDAS